MQRKVVPFEVKEVDVEQGVFEGYAAVFGNIDDGGDVIEKGAFAKTLMERGQRVKICWQHDPREPIGKPLEMREDERGLYVKAKISLTQRGRDALTLLRDGVVNELSIGYDAVKEAYEGTVRRLREVKLWEISPVTWAMNPLATVTDVKGATPFQDLPLADEDRAWDAAAARQRVAKWAGGPDKDKIDWGKYRKACFWYDETDPENYGSYKLFFADVIDGKLMAVPRGIMAAGNVMVGARGGVDIPEDDVPAVKNHIARYYKKMDKEPPWEKGEKSAMNLLEKALGRKASDLITTMNEAVEAQELWEQRWRIQDAFFTVMENILRDEEMDAAAKVAAFSASLDQFKELMMAWFTQYLNVAKGKPAIIERKEGRVLSKRNRDLLQQAIDALQALLAAAESAEEPDGKSTPGGQEPPKDSAEPDNHSVAEIAESLKELKRLFQREVA